MKIRLYLDTSVLSLLDDDRSPERRDLTREFWQRRDEFEISTSEVTRREILGTADAARRDSMLAALATVAEFSITPEHERVAAMYVARGIFPVTVAQDSLHVAAAVMTGHQILVSWNFKHLVNQRRRGLVNQLNTSLGLPHIAILPPPEI